jgi:hypothetical protein
MPVVRFVDLPGNARVWTFAATDTLDDAQQRRVLEGTDQFLETWAAHGSPLTCAREWRDGRFLAVGVDGRTENASGCSIDGLFRVFKALQSEGINLLPSASVFWRDRAGVVCSGSRAELAARAKRGEVDGDTPVFDTTVTSADDWRHRFERPAGESWHAGLIGVAVSSSS